jgi:hypothetical protein
MEKITFLDREDLDGTIIQHAIIEHTDGSFTSMLKSTYDEQQAEQSTPSVTNGD